MRVCTIAGIPVGVNASFLLIYALIAWSLAVGYFPGRLPGLDPVAYWANGLLAALLLFASVLVHELAHSLVAIRHGLCVRGITLHVLGGVSQIADEPPSPRAEMLIAGAGPLASFAIAGGLWLLRATDVLGATWASAIVAYLVLVNVAIGLFNLIPGFPLDGGRILRAVAWWSTGDLARATAVASRAGRTVAVALIVLGALQTVAGALLNGMWLIFIGLFLHQAASTSRAHAAARAALGPLTVADLMLRDVVTVASTASVADLMRRFWAHHVTSVPVVDGARVRGVASVHDLGAVPIARWEATPVADVMRPLTDDLTIAPDATAFEALGRAAGNGVGRLVILDGDRLAGSLSIEDLTRVLATRGAPATGPAPVVPRAPGHAA